ncbi:MAG: hypothetical protein ABEL76_08860 [Bradymonadaceae bacterium]
MLVLVGSLLLAPARAGAHGDVPLARRLESLPGEDGPTNWVLSTNFGVMTSSDPDGYVCEESFRGGIDFQIAVLGVHQWVLFTEGRILRTDDGCTFETVRMLPARPRDVAVRRSSDRVAFTHNGAELAGLWTSDDGGDRFERTLQRDGFHFGSVEFTAEGRPIVAGYPTGADVEQRGAARFLFGGTSVEVRRLDAFRYPKLLAVRAGQIAWLGRRNGEIVVNWGTPDDLDRHSHRVAATPSSAAFSADGSTLWIAGVGKPSAGGGTSQSRGFLVGTSTAGGNVRFERRFEDHSALCVETAAGEVYVCGKRGRDGADLQRATGSGELVDVLDFRDLRGPSDRCSTQSDVGSACPAVWPDLAHALEIEAGGDAGEGDTIDDAGAGGDVVRPKQRADMDASGCSVGKRAGRRPGAPGWLLCLIGGLSLARSRRRGRR